MTRITLDQPSATLVTRGILRIVPIASILRASKNFWSGPDYMPVGERVTIVASDRPPDDIFIGDIECVDGLLWEKGSSFYLDPCPLGQPVGSAVIDAVVTIEEAPNGICLDGGHVQVAGTWLGLCRGQFQVSDISDHLPFFDWEPSGRCEDCDGCGHGFRYLGEGDYEEPDCPTCGGTGTIDRYALVLRDAEEK